MIDTINGSATCTLNDALSTKMKSYRSKMRFVCLYMYFLSVAQSANCLEASFGEADQELNVEGKETERCGSPNSEFKLL